MRAECVPHQDICGVYAVLTEATSGNWTIAPAPTGGAEVRARVTA